LIIYGSSLDAFCCIQTLLTFGVPGDRIHLVQPPLTFQVSLDKNKRIGLEILFGIFISTV